MADEVSTPDLQGAKDAQRAVWTAGDYASVAETIFDVGRTLVDRVGVEEGQDVLDVACGTGNATLPAAAAGARVIGLDLTPKLLEIGAARAREAGLEIDWVEGDAEELPFDDRSFDVALSTMGVMFAPRQEVAAAELARVVRPGGSLGIASWTPEGTVGDFFRTVASFRDEEPAGRPPVEWGSEDRVRELLDEAFELELERTTVALEFESVGEAVGFYWERFGPVMLTAQALDEAGRGGLRGALAEEWQQHERDDGSVRNEAEYLRVVGTRRSG